MMRKEAPPRGPLGTKEGDRPVLGDITEPIEEALADVEARLAEDPTNRDLHERKYRILLKAGDRPAMRRALAQAAQVTGQAFFGVKLADALEEEGSYSKALEWRKWVALLEPEDPDTVRRLAATAVRAGDLDLAEATYTRLIELRRGDEAPLGGTFFEEMLGRGLSVEQRRKLQQMGLRLLARALATREDSAMLLESAARLGYRLKNYAAARGAYEKAIETHPGHRNALQWKVELLRVYAHLGLQDKWKERNRLLIEELKAHLKEFRGDSRAWMVLADQQIQAGDFEEAIASLKDALLADAQNTQALWELGRLYVRMGRSQEAIDYYRDIIDDPSEKKSVRRALERSLAELYFKLGHYREALEIYMREEDQNIANIAPIYEAVGQIGEAEALYLKAVANKPRDARSHLGLAEYYVRRENWEKAAAAGREGLKCHYATEEVHSNLAVALATAQMKMGQVQDALQTMDEICELYPDSIHQQFRKVKLLLMLGRKDEAQALAQEVRLSAVHQTGCAPSNSALWTLLGDCNSLLGHLAEAEEAYTNALRYDAMDATAVRGLGVLAEKSGQVDRALELYRRFVVLDPLNLATPAIKSRIKALEEKSGEMPAAMASPPPAPAPPRPAAPPQAVPAPRPAPQAAPQRPTIPGLPPTSSPRPQQQPGEGWLGDGKIEDWFQK
jgi:tetratricopeptide (TPR) repeat protein